MTEFERLGNKTPAGIADGDAGWGVQEGTRPGRVIAQVLSTAFRRWGFAVGGVSLVSAKPHRRQSSRSLWEGPDLVGSEWLKFFYDATIQTWTLSTTVLVAIEVARDKQFVECVCLYPTVCMGLTSHALQANKRVRRARAFVVAYYYSKKFHRLVTKTSAVTAYGRTHTVRQARGALTLASALLSLVTAPFLLRPISHLYDT
ncbi:hypothetical protein V8D89_016231 [Ganoderma adspersum]